MAMLAEKRQKVRWVLNPRQTAWSKDSNKFGQQYMEKMGWKAGQGIGANLQGCTEHVKVTVRSDNRGVGFKDVPEDVLPHQDNYSDLLAQLATDNPPAVTKSDEGKSLEVKSRQSRARVHYHKFTRSKDLSTYSQNDLACILGKATKPTKSPVEDSMQNEPNFVHRGNMNEYFKGKSKISCNTNFIAEGSKFKEEEEDSLYVGFGFSQVIKDVPMFDSISENCDSKEELNESANKPRKKHKMNDQRLDKPDSSFSIGDCTDTVQPLENEQDLSGSGKDSNRKRKKNDRDVELPESFAQSDFGETVCLIDKEGELNENIKTSKRKRRKVDQSMEVVESERLLPLADVNEIVQPIANDEKLSKTSKKSKKKRQKNDQSVEVPESESCLNEEEFNVKIKKSKKKLRKNDECVEVPEIESCLLQSMCTKTQPTETEKESSVHFKKSKKKRKNHHCIEMPGSANCPQTDFNETVGLHPMEQDTESSVSRSKKKRKNKQCIEVPGSASCPQTDFNETVGLQPVVQDTESPVSRSKKKRKNKQCIEVPGSASCPQTDSSETVGLHPTEQETESPVSRSKKKRKENTPLSSFRNDLDSMPINDEALKTMSSDCQPKHKKKKVKGSEMITDSQNNNTVEFMPKSQKTVKSVRFSDPLLSVLLIPSRDDLKSNPICFDNYEPENCDASLDLNVKRCNQMPDDQDQLSNLTKVADKPHVLEICEKGHQSTCGPKDIAKSLKIVVDGVTYTNGISEYNHVLPRRQKYSFDATKHIPYYWRKGAFNKFPGSNIETLGYCEF